VKTIDAVQAGQILIGKSEEGMQTAWLNRANRHGMVAGATGTGKTVTLQVLAEAFSAAGVPVFAADIKGDLSGIANPCVLSEKLQGRAAKVDVELTPHGAPVVFWDLFGEKGHPIRTTVSEMGPLLISRLLELNDARKACSTSPSRSPTRKNCCCSISTTCSRCWCTCRRTPRPSARATAMSPPPRSVRSSAGC